MSGTATRTWTGISGSVRANDIWGTGGAALRGASERGNAAAANPFGYNNGLKGELAQLVRAEES